MASSNGSSLEGDGSWKTKRLILIRHGRSVFNEILGAHKAQEWEEYEKNRKGFRRSVQEIVTNTADAVRDGGTRRSSMASQSQELFRSSSACPASSSRTSFVGARRSERRSISAQPNMTAMESDAASSDFLGRNQSPETEPTKKDFFRRVRGSVRRASHVIANVGKLNMVDHSLSDAGLEQARNLRKCVAEVVADSGNGSEIALLECKHWLVSPLLRALQTAGYALSPLHMGNNSLEMVLKPEAREIMNSNRSYDCQGKAGNVGMCVLARAVAKIAEIISESEEDPSTPELRLEKQAELSEVTRTLCSMDFSQVAHVWWKDVHDYKKEDRKLELQRVCSLVSYMLKHEDKVVGLVAHSLLFQEIFKMFWPKDSDAQDLVRCGMRNGTPSNSLDPLEDKIKNCGTLIVTWKFLNPKSNEDFIDSAHIVDAEFLFNGCMESQEDQHPETVEEAESFYGGRLSVKHEEAWGWPLSRTSLGKPDDPPALASQVPAPAMNLEDFLASADISLSDQDVRAAETPAADMIRTASSRSTDAKRQSTRFKSDVSEIDIG